MGILYNPLSCWPTNSFMFSDWRRELACNLFTPKCHHRLQTWICNPFKQMVVTWPKGNDLQRNFLLQKLILVSHLWLFFALRATSSTVLCMYVMITIWHYPCVHKNVPPLTLEHERIVLRHSPYSSWFWMLCKHSNSWHLGTKDTQQGSACQNQHLH
jgi:hypothetical protein